MWTRRNAVQYALEMERNRYRAEHDRRLTEIRIADQAALRLAKDEVDRRLAGMNELRDQIVSERGLYLTRREFETKNENLNSEIDRTRDELSKGLANVRDILADLRTAVALGPVELRSRIDTSAGEQRGFERHQTLVDAGTARWLGVAAIIVTIIIAIAARV